MGMLRFDTHHSNKRQVRQLLHKQGVKTLWNVVHCFSAIATYIIGQKQHLGTNLNQIYWWCEQNPIGTNHRRWIGWGC